MRDDEGMRRLRSCSGDGGELEGFFSGNSPLLRGADRPTNPLGRVFSDECAARSHVQAVPRREVKRRWTGEAVPTEQQALGWSPGSGGTFGALAAAPATASFGAAPRKSQKNAKMSFAAEANRHGSSRLPGRPSPRDKISQLMSPPLFFNLPTFPSPAAFSLPPSAYVPRDDEEAEGGEPPQIFQFARSDRGVGRGMFGQHNKPHGGAQGRDASRSGSGSAGARANSQTYDMSGVTVTPRGSSSGFGFGGGSSSASSGGSGGIGGLGVGGAGFSPALAVPTRPIARKLAPSSMRYRDATIARPASGSIGAAAAAPAAAPAAVNFMIAAGTIGAPPIPMTAASSFAFSASGALMKEDDAGHESSSEIASELAERLSGDLMSAMGGSSTLVGVQTKHRGSAGAYGLLAPLKRVGL